MATTYNKNEAFGRAVERARREAGAYCVYVNRLGDHMVRSDYAAPPRDFARLGTASYSDGSTVIVRFND